MMMKVEMAKPIFTAYLIYSSPKDMQSSICLEIITNPKSEAE